jgi:acetolactate decarboxylase
MKIKKISFGLFLIVLVSCNQNTKSTNLELERYSDIKITGTMKNVMWKGDLEGIVNLDSITNKKGLYGVGPESYLTGEILINDGQAYVSKVLTDSTMKVEKNFEVSAPFFVYGNVTEWNKIDLPPSIKSTQDLEKFIDEKTIEYKRPFAFKLKGDVSKAVIHIQNLPKGTHVSSPEDAHKGQTNYNLKNEEVVIIGFFSTEHKGVFTHHDSFLHLHLITKDERKMGHLDMAEFNEMELYLPKK